MEEPRESRSALQTIAESCIQCGLCVRECAFLQRYGDPWTIAHTLAASSLSDVERMTYACSLCGLCSAICPKGLNAGAMSLELRGQLAAQGRGIVRAHRRLLSYERRGSSSFYAHHGIPPGCDMVFFPGCTLAGTRSQAVFKLYEYLRTIIPRLGIILDCCTRPSHDLGRMAHFLQTFGGLRETLLLRGVSRVLTACPSCHDVFRRYGGRLDVESLYETLACRGGVPGPPASGMVTIHDPCATRFEESLHAAVRSLVRGAGLTIREMTHRGCTTLCCGEGGAVPFTDPVLADRWVDARARESLGLPVVTYCAGCVERLRHKLPMVHLIDLLFDPKACLEGRACASRAPFTYWRRLQLKQRLKRLLRLPST